MILTKTVKYYGKDKPYEELGHHSLIPIQVKCDVCQKVFTSTKYQIIRNGHELCQECVIHKKFAQPLSPGARYGNLIVISEAPMQNHESYSECICDCGNKINVCNSYLRNGHTTSCGCRRKKNFENVVHVRGEKHGNWKGGISGERDQNMSRKEYKDFRKGVFERDSYTCQKCGKIGGALNAHHIFNYSNYPTLRTDIRNGITLCEKCHLKFHSQYGRKGTDDRMIKEFLITDPESE